MTPFQHNQFVTALGKSLSDICAKIQMQGPDRWRVEYGGKAVGLGLEDQWLHFSAAFADGHCHDEAIPLCAWEILKRNADLPGAAKLVLPAGGIRVHVAAEMLLEDPSLQDPAWLIETIEDVVKATGRDATSNAAELRDAESGPDLADLCAETGWKFHRRSSDGSIAVPLDTNDGVAHAELGRHGGQRAVVTIPAPAQALSPACRQAIGLMLLRVGGSVRSVRPSIRETDGQETLTLDVFLGAKPSATRLAEALCALSVAATCIREVNFLAETELSERYLDECGRSAPAPVAAEENG